MKHRYCVPHLAAALVILTVGPLGDTGLFAQSRAVTPAPRAAGAARSTTSAADTTPVMTEYRLGAGDKLRIEVYKDTQLSQSVQIRPDGKITLPLVGDLEATDRTPLELRDEITRSLKEFITNPVVTVIVIEALSSQVFVMGEVAKSGPVQLNGPTTILQALAMAGGPNEFANKKDIRVLRQTATGIQTIKFNYRDAISGDVRPIYLRAGDTVIVR
jgi:polysaccharide export outer membrane protein